MVDHSRPPRQPGPENLNTPLGRAARTSAGRAPGADIDDERQLLKRELDKAQKAYRAQLRNSQRNEQEWRRCQEYLDLAMRHGSDVFFRLAPDGRMHSLSQAAAHLLGFEASELEGRVLYDLLAADDRKRARGYFHAVLAGKMEPPLTVCFLHGSKRQLHVEVHARLVSHPQTATPEIAALVRPRTDLVGHLPPEIWAFGLAHELNQPLSAIALAAHACERMLRAAEIDAALLSETVVQLAAQAERAGEVVRRLRQLAAGNAPKRSTMPIREIVEESLHLVQATLADGKIISQLQFADNLPTLFVDRIQIGQVLVNLLRNAAEAMVAAGSPERMVTIRTFLLDNDVAVAVSDSGPGLAPEVAQRLFQPYLTTKPHGMGLGLMLSRSLIHAHGGRLWLEPTHGQGCTFCFSLPVEPHHG